jgi:hypothetical protein
LALAERPDVHLFQPKDAYRFRGASVSAVRRGASGQNPPSGVGRLLLAQGEAEE